VAFTFERVEKGETSVMGQYGGVRETRKGSHKGFLNEERSGIKGRGESKENSPCAGPKKSLLARKIQGDA